MNARSRSMGLYGGLLALFGLALAAPAHAGRACLNDQDKKTCGSISTTPSDYVQPSGIGGTANQTWVKARFTVENLGQTSTRFVTLDLTLDPATAFRASDLTADAGLACTVSSNPAKVHCAADKLEAGQVLSGSVPALVPTTSGPFTVLESVGWQGNTASTSATVIVTDSAGSSWVPAGRSETLVTAREATVTAENPYWAQVTCPARSEAYYCRVRVVTDAPAFDCPTGIFISRTDGGPYVCRDSQQPRRWVEIDTNATFTATDPLGFVLLEHSSLVPAIQLPPTALAPTGTPPFAVFHAQNPTPAPDTADANAFADTCSATAPSAPCLTSVERLASGDWRVAGLKPNDGTDLQPGLPAAGILAPFYLALDFMVSRANADLIQPPVIMK